MHRPFVLCFWVHALLSRSNPLILVFWFHIRYDFTDWLFPLSNLNQSSNDKNQQQNHHNDEDYCINNDRYCQVDINCLVFSTMVSSAYRLEILHHLERSVPIIGRVSVTEALLSVARIYDLWAHHFEEVLARYIRAEVTVVVNETCAGAVITANKGDTWLYCVLGVLTWLFWSKRTIIQCLVYIVACHNEHNHCM